MRFLSKHYIIISLLTRSQTIYYYDKRINPHAYNIVTILYQPNIITAYKIIIIIVCTGWYCDVVTIHDDVWFVSINHIYIYAVRTA